MPKEFPQIRLNGNKKAGVQYAKRGMLELFKTQAIQERAQVPIMKRSVEVNDWTTIFVQIAEEQTFIDITCNPPGPQIEPSGPGEEKVPTGRCPAAFIIRKNDGITKGEGGYQERTNTQGYIVAYNHLRDNWEIAKYTGATGEYDSTFAKCANVGWWHASEGKANYTQCDVLTWYGSPYFDLTTNCFRADNGGDYSEKSYLQNVLMFKGHAFATPAAVLGACIIEVNNIDYFYMHGASMSDEDNAKKITQEGSWRTPVNEAMSSDSPTWEKMGEFTASDFVFQNGAFLSNDQHWKQPASTAYVDKDGYSYMLYYAYVAVPGELVEDYPGSTESIVTTVLLKYDLRNFQQEVIYDATTNIPLMTLSGIKEDGFGTDTIRNNNDGTMSTNWSYSQNEPHIIHMWSGTKDLWTMGIQWQGSAHHSVTHVSVKNGTRSDTMVGGLDVRADLVLFKNLKEVKRIPALRNISGGAVVDERVDFVFQPSNWSDWYGDFVDIALLGFHPEIKDSWMSVERRISNSRGDITFDLIEGTKRTNLSSLQRGPQITYSSDPARPDIFGYQQTGASHTARLLTAPLSLGGSITGSDTININLNKLIGMRRTTYTTENPGWYDSQLTEHWYVDAVGGNSAYYGNVQDSFTTGGSLGYVTYGGIQLGSTDGKWDAVESEHYGLSTTFVLPKFESRSAVVVKEGYAVHHNIEIDGKSVAPYIFVKRDYKVNPGFNPTSGAGDSVHGKVAMTLENAGSTDLLYVEDPGYLMKLNPPEGEEGEHFLNADNWKLKSNVLTEKQLKQLTKETDNMWLEIGVL